MGISPLASWVKYSPNCSSPRNNTIKGISIHHMAGNLSIESCGNWFAQTRAQASSHYGVGSDGRIGAYLDENDRAWCCASRAIDNQVVTIEVADDGSNPWHSSDAAIEATIELCVDICKRNNLPGLFFAGDKNLMLNDPSKQNLIPHSYCYPTDCPSAYLLGKYPYICDEVNKRLGNGYTSSGTKAKTNEKMFFDFFTAVGLNPMALCGLMGNIYAESGLTPNNLQNTYEKSLGMSDTQYTAAVDSGSYTRDQFINDKAGYGLAQWTYHSRKEKLYDFAKASYASIGDMGMQLAYLWKELQSSIDIAKLNASKSVREASDIILLEFERPADQSESVQIRRASYGLEFYQKFYEDKKEDTSDAKQKPFNIEVTVDCLNVRSGPGTNFGVTCSIMDRGTYGIDETSAGPGANSWGKMSNGWGWISLDHTKRSNF